MISCDRASDLFGPAWDDELSVAERESLETHFAACPACQRNYDEFARTLELVQTLPRPVASDDFADRVLRAARARELGLTRHEGRSAIFAAFGGRLALAAAVLATVGVGALVLTRPHDVAPVATRTAFAPSTVSAPAPTTALPIGDPDGPVTALTPAARPVLASVPATRTAPAPSTARRAARAALPGSAVASIVPDSLFDHSQDVDFVLDPVKLRRERGRGYTPVTSSVQGQAASITF